jgi:choline dehydrogenase-like flavoprotein
VSEPKIAIIGSGIAGAALAWRLVRQGHSVVIFEKGPAYPYPHQPQFHALHELLLPIEGEFDPPRDIKAHTFTGTWKKNLEFERFMRAGGACTVWEALSPRMRPADFQRRTLLGFGDDWPLRYEDLEEYFCQAEELLGVAGTDEDNPFAPPRSKPYPLPPFELSWDDQQMAGQLAQAGIILHSTPQARTRLEYEGRSQCVNLKTCKLCPIGARYSPNHHLQLAAATGRCEIRVETSIRRLIRDSSGRIASLIVRPNDASRDEELAVDWIVLAAGTMESTRLLLLSADSRSPNGLGNEGGHLGKHLTFHHIWHGEHRFDEPLWPGRVGPWTGQCDQFLDPPSGLGYGGMKVEYSSRTAGRGSFRKEWRSADDVLASLRGQPFIRHIALHAESCAGPEKRISLSEAKDRFGDPLPHVHYELTDFDLATFEAARALSRRFATAVGAEERFNEDPNLFRTAFHQMGSCRMGESPADSVVDTFGRVHGIDNLFLAGSTIFRGTSGAVNPTLTIVALALRTADQLLAEL